MAGNGRDDEPASKAEFVWLMVKLGMLDRETYREVRADGWDKVTACKILLGKSESPN